MPIANSQYCVWISLVIKKNSFRTVAKHKKYLMTITTLDKACAEVWNAQQIHVHNEHTIIVEYGPSLVSLR